MHSPTDFSPAARAVFGWLNSKPLIAILMYFMLVDMITGLFAGFKQKKLSSDISLIGMTKKAFIWLVVSLGEAIQPFAGGMPVAKAVAAFYIFNEFLSIVENAGRAGVPMPPALMQAMSKLGPLIGTPQKPLIIEKHTIERTQVIPDRRQTDRESRASDTPPEPLPVKVVDDPADPLPVAVAAPLPPEPETPAR